MAERFHFVTPGDLEQRIRAPIPRNASYAVNTWNTWPIARNSAIQFGQPMELNNCVCYFVMGSNSMTPGYIEQTPGYIEQRIQAPPKNTKKNTKWGVNTWNTWSQAKSMTRQLGQPKVPTAAELQFVSPVELNNYLCYFVLETRNKNGVLYPKDTLYNLMCGLARYLKEELHRPDLNFMNPSNTYFQQFRQSLKSQMKLASEQGIGNVRKQAQSVSSEQENILWEKGILNSDTAEGLSKAVYFYNCKVFGICGRYEHRNLEVEQYIFRSDDGGQFIEFHERANQNTTDGLDNRSAQTKQIKHYDTGNDLSVYKVFEKYISCIGNTGYFYRKPISTAKPGCIIFGVQRLPIQTLSSYMSNMMKDAGFIGNYTGHSGKVTLVSRLLREGVDEQLVKERTSHRSDAAHCNKRKSPILERSISEIVDIPQPKVPKLSMTPTPNSSTETSTSVIIKAENPDRDDDDDDDVVLLENFEEQNVKVERGLLAN